MVLKSVQCAVHALALGVALSGCGAAVGTEDDSDIQSLEQAISQGVSVATGEFAAVVRISVGGVGACTGVKITQGATTSRFLTAGHCVNPNATSATISNANNGGGATTFPVPAGGIHVHPSYALSQTTSDAYYDVAVVDVSNATSAIPVAKVSIGGAVLPGDVGTAVGYGCNAPGSGAGVKRKGTIAATQPGQFLNHVHSIHSVGNPGLCSGDSGGPLFKNFGGTPLVVGVASLGDDQGATGSSWARVDNIFEWIPNPLPANAPALLANGSTVFITNTGSTRGWCLAASSSSTAAPVLATLEECDNALGVIGTRPPGWTLLTSPTGGSTFRIKNRWNNFCLTVDQNAPLVNGANVIMQACTSSSTSNLARSQAWSFQNPTGGVVGRTVTNQFSGLCLGTLNGVLSNGTRIVQRTGCSATSSRDQGWMLVK